MNGHIRKRGKKWYVVLYLGRDENGKQKQRWLACGEKKDAEAKLHEILYQANTGGYVEPSKMTFGEYLSEWLDSCAQVRVRPKTFTSYQLAIQKHINPRLGDIPLLKLSPIHLQTYYQTLLKEGRLDSSGKPTGKPLSPSTVLRQHRIIHNALSQAVKWGMVSRNIADAVEPPKAEQHEMRPLNQEQVTKFLDAVKATKSTSDRYALYALAISTGMRQGELLGLRWSDVDLDNKQICVRQILQRAEAKPIFAPPKTARSNRRIALSHDMVKLLRQHKVKQNEEKLKYGELYNDYDLVFTVKGGRPISPRNLLRQFKSLLKKAGLPDIRFHDLRHTCATLLLQQDVHPKIVSERLGHSQISITLDTYSHVLPNMQQQAADMLDTTLFDSHKK